MRRIAIVSLSLTLALVACAGRGEGRVDDPPHSSVANNVILLIGDGLGFSHITLCEMLHGPLALDELPVTGLVKTQASDRWVTDSAASATAIASGVKTRNGSIAVDPSGASVRTLFEDAREHGLGRGIVTTSRVTHATPAAFVAHVDSRAREDEIAHQTVSAELDVLIGGGKRLFSDEAISQMRARGALVGLDADDHMPYVLDREEMRGFLAEMTRKAIDHLHRNERGFFLMVEGARIDHAGHDSDAAGTVAEVLAFDAAVRVALDFAKADGETLVVVTSDHGTGALAITDKVQERKERFENVTASTRAMGGEVLGGRPLTEVLAERAGITDLSEEEARFFASPVAAADPATAIGEIVGKRLGVTFIPLEYRTEPPNRTHGHDGSMVPLYAHGPGAEGFSGTFDNTDIAGRIRERMGW